jgi:hypothetical protein
MPTSLEITYTATQYKGLAAVTAKYNAGLNEESEPLTPEEYAQMIFGSALDSYALAVTSIPSSAFVLRFTPQEIEAIMTAAQVSAEVAEYVKLVMDAPTVSLVYPPVIDGLNAIEAAGLIGSGRAAEILEP